MNRARIQKRNRKLRKPIAVLTAAVLAFAMVPQTVAFGQVEVKEDGEVRVIANKGEVINETRNTDIVAKKYGLYIENNGESITYTLNGNVDAAKEGNVSAIRMGGTNITLKTGDVTATDGRAFYADFAGGKVTLGNLKSKGGISAMSIGKKNSLELTAGNMESETSNHLTNHWYGSAEGGNVTANFGDITTTKGGCPLALTTLREGTMNVKAGKLNAYNEAGLSISGSSDGKAVVNVGEIVTAGDDFRATGIYTSGGNADIDVTVDGNITSEGRSLSLGDGGIYKVFGDVTSKAKGFAALSNWSNYSDTDVLVTGTVTAAGHGFENVRLNEKTKYTLTLWKLVWGEKSNAFNGDDENETFAKTVNYIVKTVHPLGVTNAFKVVKADGVSALDTKTYKHGDKDETFEIAHQGDRLYITSDKKILKAYNGSGANKVELPRDAAGNYYYDVVKGGGIELSADIEGVTPITPTAAPAPTAEPNPTAAPTPTDNPAPTATPTASPIVKKANPIKVTPRRIYGDKKHNVVVKRSRAFTIENAKGTLTFEKVSATSHKITIDKKTGDVTIKKRLKPDKNYFMTVKITAAGNAQYKSKTVKVELRIRIKD